jgi:hypothetical protein
MRAKSVNEAQEFQRGKSPKAAMGIGGVNLMDIYEDKMMYLQMDIENIKREADEEWEEYLMKTFIGKKITADMITMTTFNLETGEKTPDSARKRGNFTIDVKDIKPGEPFTEAIGRNVHFLPNVIVVGTDNKIYTMRLDQKIYIE